MTTKEYTSCCESRLKVFKGELASAVSGSVFLKDHLKELLASLGEETSSRGHIETGPSFEAEMNPSEANDTADLNMKYPLGDGPAIDHRVADKLITDAPGANN